ncbi:hypothetical protein R3X46_25115, partial [Salmonella enterica subsp. enterica serovar Agona]|nr:hypothetical protein [Salmonella enterica subsp. enterica serovar Agona]
MFAFCFQGFPRYPSGGYPTAHVIGALPAAQIADGVDVRVLLPGVSPISVGGIPDSAC